MTRAQYAHLMSMPYTYLKQEDLPDYDEENVVVDCGMDDYELCLMTQLGDMYGDGDLPRLSVNRS